MTGSGTASDPYIIQNVTDLQAIENDLSAYYELEGNIDASATSGWNGGLGFDPINSFTGQLDGKGYYVTGLVIDRPADLPTESGRAALFELGMTGTIQDMGLESCDITGQRAGCFAVQVDTGGIIRRCYSTGAVYAEDTAWAGGFVYQVKGAVSNCYSRCSVGDKGSGSTNGGGFGYDNDGSIDDCYSTGAVTTNFASGFCHAGDNTVTNCFWDTETSGVATDTKGATGKTTAEMKIHHTYLVASWDFKKIWKIDANVNNAYPSLGQITTISERDTWLEGPYFCYYDDYGTKRKVLGNPAASGLPWWYFL